MVLFHDVYIFLKLLEYSICYFILYINYIYNINYNTILQIAKVKRLSINNLNSAVLSQKGKEERKERNKERERKKTKEKLQRRWLSCTMLAIQE